LARLGVARVWRAVAAGVSVILGAVSGVVTALVTTHPSRGLWTALGVAVVVGAALQVAVTYRENSTTRSDSADAADKRRHVEASGAGAVAIGGAAKEAIQTHVHGIHDAPTASGAHDGVAASGAGAVGIGSDAAGTVSTDVTGETK
jgi:hypothetical protein